MKIQEIKVWDKLIRFFHWSLVLAFIISFASGDDLTELHVLIGYYILGLIIIRLVWGLVGSQYARFSEFVTSPSTAIQYVKQVIRFKAKSYIGHNPAGGWMILFMLISLTITATTGLMAYAAEESAGPLYAWVSLWPYGLQEFAEEAHEVFANFTLLLVFVHVVGVVAESFISGDNLVRAMLTGKKRIQK